MRCENCGIEMANEWRFCPKCGFRFSGRKDVFNAVFGNIFSKMDREMKSMDRAVERHMEMFDLTPFMRPSAGFSVKITRSGQQRPQVSVRTFGNIDRQGIEQRVQRLVGASRPVAREEEPIPAATEEPKTAVMQKGGVVVVEVELPGVTAEKDVHITELEDSLEIKAFADDKAYFKIITKPQRARFKAGAFEKGKLSLEFSP